MPRKSALKELKCLVASFKPVMLVQNNDAMKDAQNIEGLYRYVVELFDGIARNETNEFSGKFDFSVSLTPSIFNSTTGVVSFLYTKFAVYVCSFSKYPVGAEISFT